ncbi:hypothetical protein KGF57_001207 [Candida theae]|uniref:Sodium/calcium exchanger membrane region domain-containing protein n=1 Tax=Candida theae TaxID=1198502 RepID=A0AAD5BHD3_9ASCO|nr:uncharacterized protein KGF57_001207 [Candida theae]KAI5963832.1 hypothetical protein KGF57_001207 [Candida theae]
MFLSLGLTASEFLCPNLHTISKSYLKIPDNLAGLTILAFGNSAPDIFGTYEAIKAGSIQLALAELIGASLFISTCVIGCIGVVQPFQVPRWLFTRDVATYCTIYTLISVSALIGQLTRVVSVVLVGVYVFYVAVAIYSHKMQQSRVNAILRDRRSRGEFGDSADDEVAIDEVYLDGISQLPTIDDVNIGGATATGDTTNATGTFGLRKLMEDLSAHSNLGGSIQLDTERQLLSTPVEGMEQEEGDGATYESRVTPFSRLVDLFCPQLSNFKECHPGAKLKHLLLLPVSLTLKISTPVRHHTSMLTIEQDFKPNTAHNAFNYTKEKLRLTIQTGIGCFILLSANTSVSWVWKITIYSIISVGFGQAVYKLYPIPSSDHFPQRMTAINYITSILGLVISLSWISLIAAEIINILQVISTAYRLSDDVLGITLFALGNSVGDFVTNYTIAKMGYPIMAFAACFGSPLMALCSFGLSGLIADGNHAVRLTPTLLIGLVTLFSNMAILCVMIPKNDWSLNKKVGRFLIANWSITCLLCLLIEFTRQ